MSKHLMAKMRRGAGQESASPFEWEPWHDPELHDDDDDTERWHVPMETGHRLVVWDSSINEPHWDELVPGSHQYGEVPADPPGSHWKGGIDHGVRRKIDPEEHAAAGFPEDWHVPWTPVYHNRSKLRAKAYPTREKAMRAVEQKFQQMYPVVGRPGVSAPAPEDVGRRHEPPDEDFSYIFGGDR